MSAEINLLAQLGILVALLVGVAYAKRLKFSLHGYLAFLAVAINLVSIVLVMLPSAAGILGGASRAPLRSITAVHSFLGLVTEAVGVYIIWVWRFRRPGGSCFKLRSYMRPLVVVWLITLILGVSVYFNIYGGFRVFAKV